MTAHRGAAARADRFGHPRAGMARPEDLEQGRADPQTTVSPCEQIDAGNDEVASQRPRVDARGACQRRDDRQIFMLDPCHLARR
jgi:hypothetical protein